MNQDRDPVNPAALAALVVAVYAAEGVEAEEATAKAFLDALLEQGVVTPAEHGDAYLEEAQSDSYLDVRLCDVGYVRVDLDGYVDFFAD